MLIKIFLFWKKFTMLSQKRDSQTIQTFKNMQFDPKLIRENALRFSKERFEKEIKEFVEEKYNLFQSQKEL